MGTEQTVTIFDTTLRDGEQTPGASLSAQEKMEIARQLARLGVDIIEAGFPKTSPGDLEAVRQIALEVAGPMICGLARVVRADIEAAAKALEGAPRPMIHTFAPTSPVQMTHQLKKSPAQVLAMTRAGVELARSFCEEVEFSPMDATRTDFTFLKEIVTCAIEAGARSINVPDTVGYAVPWEFGRMIARLIAETPGAKDVRISVHCHNDLGLAVANTLAAIDAGARQVECAVNGLGERAGNAALEEVVMALRTRSDLMGVGTNVVTTEIAKTSRLVSALTGIPVQPNKAVVGENAFAHESGIHQDGVLKERTTYEIMSPQDVGLSDSKLVLGKLSGSHAFAERVASLGFALDEEDLGAAFDRFKDLADRKKEIYDEDIEAIVEQFLEEAPETFLLSRLHISSGTGATPMATVTLSRGGEDLTDAACGDGPVDAVYKTIDRITGAVCRLLDYKIRAVTRGRDAQGEVSIRVTHDERIYHGRAVSTDIIEASAEAYLKAVNRMLCSAGS